MMPILKNTFSKIDHVRGEKSDDQFRHIGLRYIKVANSKQDRFGFSSLQFFFPFYEIRSQYQHKHEREETFAKRSRSKLIAFHDNHWQRPAGVRAKRAKRGARDK